MSDTKANAQRAITIGATAEELYRRWQDPQVLTAIMGDLADVSSLEGNRSRWIARDRNGQQAEWETQIVEQSPGERVRWSSPPGSEFTADGEVRFRPAPGDRGTETHLRMHFEPAGAVQRVIIKTVLGEVPNLVAEKVLRRFKSLVETGEIPTLAQQPAARDGGRDT